MDPCVPGTSLEDARASARAKLGVPAKYAAKMSVESICKAFKFCKKTNIMPPMDYRRLGDKVYLIDPKSPLSIQDFTVVLGTGDLTRIAKKLGLMTNEVSRSELKSNIIKILQTLNISEPIELPSHKVREVLSENLGVRNNAIPSNNTLTTLSNNNLESPNGSPLSPESGETPYSSEVAPNYFKLKPSPTKVSTTRSPNFNFNNYNSANYNSPNYTRHVKIEKPSPSKVSINNKSVTQQQINNNMKRVQRLKNMIVSKTDGGTQTSASV
jgi:hypothetical protein